MPRTKTQDQIFAELQALCDAGYRGHVDFVDDNFIGNKKNLRTLLPRLKAWLEERDYPFEFSTEASINIADDDELVQAIRKVHAANGPWVTSGGWEYNAVLIASLVATAAATLIFAGSFQGATRTAPLA